MIYFDYSATTPMSNIAIETYSKVAKEYYGNSRSLHRHGQESADVLEMSRRSLSDILDCHAEELYFTGSGSEATFLALTSLAFAHQNKGRTILTTKGEHHSVHQALHYLENLGFTISYLPVDQYGKVEISDLLHLLNEDVILVSIGHANSEVGTVQDLQTIGRILNEHKILFHCDCVQTFGKIPIPLSNLTSISVSAHKCYGPKGVGLAYIQKQIPWNSFLRGTTHENGFRAGTIDTPAIAAFTAAAEESAFLRQQEMERLAHFRDLFLQAFHHDNRLILEGHPTERLPFHLALRLKGIEGQLVMLECNRRGLSISTGSACRVGDTTPSSTLMSVGRTKEEAYELIRITFGRWTTKEDVDKLIIAIKEILERY
ncbi:IscS subfamily cysteine desulfurase [Bacillus sp. JCM 19034]|uniref:IscS subfamily cysteine desulfurase n=1 Tax=Bacillus sp. JCM 19034 TaxID=1481928 RepID=UPI0007811073|nr:IscS subfamily cysteine desulfurase [Bacillus sp. JCM 19034]